MQVDHNQREVAQSVPQLNQRISRISPETTHEPSDIEQGRDAAIPAPRDEVTQTQQEAPQEQRQHEEEDKSLFLLFLAYKLKSAGFLCFLFVLSAQFMNCSEAYDDLNSKAPIVTYHTIANLSYLFLEAVFYFVISILEVENRAVGFLTYLVQGISAGLMIWGYQIIIDKPFQNFKNLSIEDNLKHDLVMAVQQMVDLRVIYIIMLLIFKLMWYFMPQLQRTFGLTPVRKQTKEDIINYLSSKAMNYDKTSCETESCAICLLDFENQGPKVVALDCNSKHVFHVECMNKWIEMKQNKCPMCRQVIKIQIPKDKEDKI